MTQVVDPIANEGVLPHRAEWQPYRLRLNGDGVLAGTWPDGITTLDLLPVSATVRVLLRAKGHPGDGTLVAEVQSGPDGTWRVEGLPSHLRYDVVGRYRGRNDVIWADVAPFVEGHTLPAYAALILSHNPKGYWKFNESSGLGAADYSGNNVHATIGGTVAFGAPSLIPSQPADTAMSNLATGWATVTVPAGYFPLVGSTWVFNVKLNTAPASASNTLWHLGNLSVSMQQGLNVYVDATGALGVRYLSGSWHDALLGFTLEVGTVYRLALRVDSATKLSLFVNGVFEGETTLPAALPSVASITTLRIGGANWAGWPSPADATLDDFAVFDKLLTDYELQGVELSALG